MSTAPYKEIIYDDRIGYKMLHVFEQLTFIANNVRNYKSTLLTEYCTFQNI